MGLSWCCSCLVWCHPYMCLFSVRKLFCVFKCFGCFFCVCVKVYVTGHTSWVVSVCMGLLVRRGRSWCKGAMIVRGPSCINLHIFEFSHVCKFEMYVFSYPFVQFKFTVYGHKQASKQTYTRTCAMHSR